MPLTGKYIKYQPEITLEIFTLVWNKLIKYGWTIYNTQSINEVYSYISKGNEWKGIKHDRNKTFMQYQNTDNLSETTVQEILGYDPFVKEFVLPEKWCVKVTKDNVKTLTAFKRTTDLTSPAEGWEYVEWNGNGTFNMENGYTEITFDQFKQYVLKENIEVKKVIPEYVECVKQLSAFTLGEIYKTDTYSSGSYRVISRDGKGGQMIKGYEDKFKPSTKEAFDAQNKLKSIKKWSVGSYVVIIKEYGSLNIGEIHEISDEYTGACIDISKSAGRACLPFKTSCEWFSIRAEAEEFAKTLIQPVKEKVKQPLKQAVHCKTQEEWDFVTEKLNYNWIHTKFKINRDCISLSAAQNSSEIYWKSKDYQILSFQEWCDLNGYKMENKCEFIEGKWYKNSDKTYAKCYQIIGPGRFQYNYVISSGNYSESFGTWDKHDNMVEASIEEIQQYLPDGHVDKINWNIKPNEKFKTGEWVIIIANSNNSENCIGDIGTVLDDKWKDSSGIEVSVRVKVYNRDSYNNYTRFNEMRHATPEEINNHLISIGQIPVIKDAADYVKQYGLEQLGNEIHKQILSVDTAVGLDYSAKVTPWDFYGVSSRIADSGVGIHQGYFNPNIVAPRKISSSIADSIKDEVQLELMDIPKI